MFEDEYRSMTVSGGAGAHPIPLTRDVTYQGGCGVESVKESVEMVPFGPHPSLHTQGGCVGQGSHKDHFDLNALGTEVPPAESLFLAQRVKLLDRLNVFILISATGRALVNLLPLLLRKK